MALPPIPHRKVNAAALAGGVSIILVWAIKEFSGHAIPGEVASGLTTVLSFIVSYLVPEADAEE